MKVRKILVNIEEGGDPQQALSRAAWIATRTQAQIELFCCCFSFPLRNAYLLDKPAFEHAAHGYMNHIEQHLEALAEPLREQGLRVGVDVAWERQSLDAVLRKVERFEPDLVIQQLKPHNLVEKYLMTGADWQLLRECRVPLLLVKDREWHDYIRVCACVDPFHSEDQPAHMDKVVLNNAQRLAAMDGELNAVHCFYALPHSAILDEHAIADFEALQTRVRIEHKEALRLLLAPYGLQLDSDKVYLVQGESHRELPVLAQEQEIDVMVMGGIARSFLDRLLVGSTVERVLDEISSDILVVHADSK